MTDTVDRLVRMLDEERRKKERARDELGRERGRALQTSMDNQCLERERDQLRGDLMAAIAKVEEWFNYSQAWWPLVPRRRHKELKASVPKPLDYEVPF